MSLLQRIEKFVNLFERLAKIQKELLIFVLFFFLFSEKFSEKLVGFINLIGAI